MKIANLLVVGPLAAQVQFAGRIRDRQLHKPPPFRRAEAYGEAVMSTRRIRSISTIYEINRTNFLLWKEHTSAKWKVLIFAIALFAVFCFLAALLM